MEYKLQRLMDELGDAINSSLSSSERFPEIMGEIENAGYNAYVVLEASIGFQKKGESEGASGEMEILVPPQPRRDSFRNTEMSAADLDFLRELKISA